MVISNSITAITMTIAQFPFLGHDKCKTAIAATAISLNVLLLLLLPASLGYGRTIFVQEAFGQFNLPLLEEPEEDTTTPPEDGGIVVEDEEEEETATTTTPTTPTPAAPTTTVQDPSAYLMADRNVDPVYGFLVSTLPTQGGIGSGGGISSLFFLKRCVFFWGF